jgi:amino acid adenylation domain-containing protein
MNLIYNPDVYDQEQMEHLMRHYKRLLNKALLTPSVPVGRLNYLSDAEREELLETFNNTNVSYPKEKNIVDLFAEQVEKGPDEIAIAFENKTYTYKELDEQSNQLAHYLQENYQLQIGDFVGIRQNRSEWLLVCILGILKTGGAYVPIDPGYPKERIEFIEQDTQSKVCLDQKELNHFIETQDLYSTSSVAVPITANSLAYVMYTSGSTGRSKGVMIEHHSVVRLVKNTNIYSFSPKDKLLSTGSVSFDATTFEYWGPLLNGGSVILSSHENLLDSNSLSTLIKVHSVNIMWFTAGWLHQLVESDIELFEGLTTLLAGGDKLSSPHIKQLREKYPLLEIINGYGPTENTTFSIVHHIQEVEGDILLGRPIHNTSVYILNELNQLQPKGVVGEICLSGDGLARGYLNLKELTTEKFIDNPFNLDERLYKTGDLGRWTTEGYIEFFGRVDDQVKIRGYRIELGEIENAIQENPEINGAVVMVKLNESGEKDLVAYLTSQEEQNTSKLRIYLSSKVPSYMVPTVFIQLDSFPLGPNGKVNKSALPSPEDLGLSTGVEYVAPTNEMEEKLVKIFSKVLGKKETEIGVNDNFFDLGANSLRLIKIQDEINKEFQIKLGVTTLFQYPNIRELLDFVLGLKSTLEDDDVDEMEIDLSDALDDMMDFMSE